MSTERPLQTRPDFDPDQPDTGKAPDHAPEYIERTDSFNMPEGHDRRRLGWAVKLGVPAAAAALAGGLFLGKDLITHNNPNAGKAGNRPTATASANPGETQPSVSASTPSAQETTPTSIDLQHAHITVDINGQPQTFTGTEAAAAALHAEIQGKSTDEVPSVVMTKIIPSILNMSSDVNSWKTNAGYSSGGVNGESAVADDITKDLLAEALTGKTYDSLAGSSDISEASTASSILVLDGIAFEVEAANAAILNANPNASLLMQTSVEATGNPDEYQLTDNSAQIPKSTDQINLVQTVAQSLHGSDIVTSDGSNAYLDIAAN